MISPESELVPRSIPLVDQIREQLRNNPGAFVAGEIAQHENEYGLFERVEIYIAPSIPL